MKDNLQNIADLIGALAEDIEEIKKKLVAKDSPDKDDWRSSWSLLYGSLAVAHRKTSMPFSEAKKPSRIIRNHWAMKWL